MAVGYVDGTGTCTHRYVGQCVLEEPKPTQVTTGEPIAPEEN
jgi:hypothetical protein